MNDTDLLSHIEDNINYINPSRYISGRVVEYDMKSANISLLLQKGVIDLNTYIRLNSMPKRDREIEVGLMIKNNTEIYNILSHSVIEYKRKLIESNNIDQSQIVRVANDAIYINTSVDLKYTKFDNYIEFRIKSISNVMININKILVFILFLPDGSIQADVKGISNDKYAYHSNFMLSIIANTILYIERVSIKDALEYITKFIDDYINRRIDIGFYREFNSDSMYIINANGMKYGVPEVGESYKDIVDINYNLTVLRELWSIVLELYNRRK